MEDRHGVSGIPKYFNRQLFLSVLLIALSTFNYGFDNQAFATTQAMDAFTKKFGEYNSATGKWAIPATSLSLLNSLNYIGFGAGVVVGSFVSATYGRRVCMFCMSIYAIGTATVTVTASNYTHILAARILNYGYVGMELSVVPVFQSEIVPIPVRGLIVGTYQLSLIVGGLVINVVCRFTSTLPDDRAFRIPFGLFYIIPSIILSLILFIPESPRWLLTKDRAEDALVSLKRLREGAFTEEEIALEFAALQDGLRSEAKQCPFVKLFHGTNLKRTAIVCLVNFFQQATGQAFASQYGAIFVKSIGTINTFSFTIINACVNTVSISISLLLTDKLGRGPLLMAGAAIQAAALITMGSLGTVNDPSKHVKSGIVAMVSIFAAGFSVSWAPLTYVVTTEIPDLHLRDHSQCIASVINVATNFLVNFSIPYLLYAPYAALGSKVGFIFGCIAVLAGLFTWIFVPECKGKSLEDVDQLFIDGVAMRHFGRYEPSSLAAKHLQDGEFGKSGDVIRAREAHDV